MLQINLNTLSNASIMRLYEAFDKMSRSESIDQQPEIQRQRQLIDDYYFIKTGFTAQETLALKYKNNAARLNYEANSPETLS